LPDDGWCFNFQQPVVKPMGQARYWMEVLLEAAERLELLPDLYTAFNAAAQCVLATLFFYGYSMRNSLPICCQI